MRKIGINLDAVREIPIGERVKLLSSLGFETVFTCYHDMETLMNCAIPVAQEGMTFDTLHAPWRDINEIWHDSDTGLEVCRYLRDCVDACTEVNAPIAVVHLSSGLTPPPPTDIGRGRFIELVNYAAGKNIKIAFENQRMLGNIAWAFEEFKDAENVGFCWDVGHEACFTGGRHYMPLFGHRLICTHIHDNTAVFDADEHRIPFDGVIDFDSVAKQLRDFGYTGALMLEVSGRSEIYSGIDNVAFFERAAAAIKRIRDMVDAK